MKWVAVVNPSAGTKARTIPELEAAAARAGIKVEFHTTHRLESVQAVVDAAVGDEVSGFVAVGGDGTIHSLINALMSHRETRRFTVAVVPSGSGSDMTRTFAHTTDVDAAFDRIAAPQPYGIDLGRIELPDGSFRYFVNVADVGVAAEAVRMAQRLPRWMGRTKYTAAFWLTLAGSNVPTVNVRVDRHQFEGPAINIVVANGQFFGGGMNIAPRASMADGKFDIQIFTGKKRQAFSVMPRVLTGGHLTHRAVRRFIGSSITIDGPRDLALECDGELIGSGPVTIKVVPDVIDFVL